MTTPHSRTLTAEELMASPRGCSLLFALVSHPPGEKDLHCNSEDEPWTDAERLHTEFMETASCAQHCIDRQRRLTTHTYSADSSRPGRAKLQNESVRPADAAAKLRLIRPAPPTQSELQDAMAEMIAGAMYWQPPHAEAVLAAAPVMREALLPFARALIDSGLVETWSRPPDLAGQWALAWDDSEHRGTLPAVFSADPANAADIDELTRVDHTTVFDDDMPGETSAQRSAQWTVDMLAAEARYRRDFVKDPHQEVSGAWFSNPHHGLWSSTGTWPDGEPTGLDLVEDDFGLERARACRLRIRPEVRICVIHHPEDWADLCRRYPLDVTAQRRRVWFETTGRKGRWVIPDWSQVAEEYDGVHVSLAGYLRTAGGVIEVGDGSLVEDSPTLPTLGNTGESTVSLMAGWNPDTTYWLNDVIMGVAEVVEWSYDSDADAWRRG